MYVVCFSLVIYHPVLFFLSGDPSFVFLSIEWYSFYSVPHLLGGVFQPRSPFLGWSHPTPFPVSWVESSNPVPHLLGGVFPTPFPISWVESSNPVPRLLGGVIQPRSPSLGWSLPTSFPVSWVESSNLVPRLLGGVLPVPCFEFIVLPPRSVLNGGPLCIVGIRFLGFPEMT